MKLMKPFAATNANLANHALAPAMRYLIAVALDGSVMTYGELGAKLEAQDGFSKIFTTRVGFVAGSLMDKIQSVELNAPLINVLVVNQKERVPSEGAGSFMAARFDENRLDGFDAKSKYPALWKRCFERAAGEVYLYSADEWSALYHRTFGETLSLGTIEKLREQRLEGTEKDGDPVSRGYEGGGEGPEHEALRLWVKDNPGSLDRNLAKATTETEVYLDSGDRVDVIYKLVDRIIVIEVKSRISSDVDLSRGVFQCIKYRAVRAAMDVRKNAIIDAILVTEIDLPDRIADLAKLHGIRHLKVAIDRT